MRLSSGDVSGSSPSPQTGIGSLRETPFHAALKELVSPPGSRHEVPVDGYIVDVVAPGLLIEVQTRSVGKLRPKLGALLPSHRVRLVIPLAQNKWIERRGAEGRSSRRRSPKRASLLHLFEELVGIADALPHPNLEVEAVMTDQLELREHVPGKAWRRRGWVVTGRELLAVNQRTLFRGPGDLRRLLPALAEPFTSRELAAAAAVTPRLAGQALYTLHRAEALQRVGKRGNAYLYRTVPGSDAPPGGDDVAGSSEPADGDAAPGSAATPVSDTMPERSSAASRSAGSGSTTVFERR